MKRFFLGIGYLFTYLFARILFNFMYDKKYLQSKYFKGKYRGLVAPGWKWVIRDYYGRLFFRANRGVRFPISPHILVTGSQNISFDADDLVIFQNIGNYYQCFGDGKIEIGKGSWIAPNVGIITANHDLLNPDDHSISKDVVIGKKCWIGMNSVILPGVTLGDNTVVGAGSVVTKSFPNGMCVIAGNPARIIKNLVGEENIDLRAKSENPSFL